MAAVMNRLHRLRTASFGLALMVLIGFGVAGCGGDSGQEEFAAEANGICTEFGEFSAGQERLFAEQVAGGDFGQAADTFEEYGKELRASIDEIAALDRPSSDRAPIDSFIESSEELTELVPGVVDALRASDTATLISVATRLQEIQAKADRVAREVGLDECAEVGPGRDGGTTGSTGTPG